MSSSTQIQLDLNEYRALLALAFAAKSLTTTIKENKENDGILEYLVESGIERVNKNFKATGLTE